MRASSLEYSLPTAVPEILPEGIEIVVSGIDAPEGPAWGPDGMLYFVSCGEACVYRLSENGTPEKVAETGGRPNGLAFSPDGTLFIADAGLKAILRVNDGGGVEVFADRHESKPFGGPNDLAFLPNGDLLFTDPARVPLPDPAMSPVFKAKPNGETSVFANELAYPNGLHLMADGSGIYIAEMRANRTVSFKFDASGNALEERLVRRYMEPAAPDGMAVDIEGRVFQTLPGLQSLALIGAGGELSELFYSPDWRPSNITFGGPDRQTLYVTSEINGNIYSFRHSIPGVDILHPAAVA